MDHKIIVNQMKHLIKALCVEIIYDVVNNNLEFNARNHRTESTGVTGLC